MRYGGTKKEVMNVRAALTALLTTIWIISPVATWAADQHVVRDDAGRKAITLDGKRAAIYIGSRGNEGDVRVIDGQGRTTLNFDSEKAALYIGSKGNEGDIRVLNSAGSSTISFDGEGGGAVFAGRTRTGVLEITGGSDVAEPFEFATPDKVKPGMVVSIDPMRAGSLRIADSAYDHAVAGIVSGANGIRPGLTLTQEGTVADGSIPVALSGRVYALASDSGGAIQPGDLLTTSDVPGHVMKVANHEQASGAVIGKAMSALNEGSGTVLVLVNLQ